MATNPRVTKSTLLRRDIAGSWLLEKLERVGVAQNQLAGRLRLAPAQVNQWIKGVYPIPRAHFFGISEVLRLSDAEFKDLLSVVDIQDCVNELYEDFLPLSARPSRPKKGKEGVSAGLDNSLAAHFTYPQQVYGRLLTYVERLVTEDMKVFQHLGRYYLQRHHLYAARNVVQDVDAFLNKGEDKEKEAQTNIWTEKNILSHLAYPHNYYLAFFIDRIDSADGETALDVRSELLIAFAASAEFITSSNRTDSVIAQHAIHMLSRHGGEAEIMRAHRLGATHDIQSKRMVLFGDAFRLGERGPFDQISCEIEHDEKLAEAVIAFDGLHYGDFHTYENTPNPTIVPIKSLLRHVHALADQRLFIRSLSITRIRSILGRYGDKIAADQSLVDILEKKVLTVEASALKDTDVQAVLGELSRVINKQRKNRK